VKGFFVEEVLMKNGIKYVGLPGIIALFALVGAAQSSFTGANKTIVSDFERRAKEYVELRERYDGQLPKLSKKATADEIQAHKTALLKSVQAARVGAKRGDVFTPEASTLVRNIIKAEFKGRDRRELRETVFEAETKGVLVKVNAAYPEAKELVEMPPSLLLALPQLPKQVRYRFVGTNLLLVDRENNLIIDYMPKAVP
jgi:hypothetical protein